jgi:single-strand DNA-binding protein
MTSSNGNAYTNITLANNDFVKGEKKTDFVSYTFFSKNAENICKYLSKGSEVIAQGKLSTNQHKDETTGKTNYKLQAIGLKIDFVGAVKNKEENSLENEVENFDTSFEEATF